MESNHAISIVLADIPNNTQGISLMSMRHRYRTYFNEMSAKSFQELILLFTINHIGKYNYIKYSAI